MCRGNFFLKSINVQGKNCKINNRAGGIFLYSIMLSHSSVLEHHDTVSEHFILFQNFLLFCYRTSYFGLESPNTVLELRTVLGKFL